MYNINRITLSYLRNDWAVAVAVAAAVAATSNKLGRYLTDQKIFFGL